MRRLLTALVAATPLIASAQAVGQILFDSESTLTINKAMCETGTVRLDYQLSMKSGEVFAPNTGEITVHAANADVTDTTAFPPCHYTGDGSTVTVGSIADPLAKPATLTAWAEGQAVVLPTQAGYSCTSPNQSIYVCAIWKDAGGAVKAYAKGSAVLLRVQAPGKPTVTGVSSGNESLYVNATAPDGSTGEAADTWRAKAVSQADGSTHYSTKTSVVAGVGTEVKISGLVNGVDYLVSAYSYSVDDNESPSSDETGPYVPQPGADAWDIYAASGGREQGGCQSGGAGLAALVGAAVFLGMRRRS